MVKTKYANDHQNTTFNCRHLNPICGTLILSAVRCQALNETHVAKEVEDLLNQLETTSNTGKLPNGLRIRIQADLIRTAGQNGPRKTHHEYWEFTAKKLYRLEPKGKKWISEKGKKHDQKQLTNILLKSNFQTIGHSEDVGNTTLFVGTEFNLGDRSIDLIVDNDSILDIGESCVGGTLSPKDSKRFQTICATV